MTLPMENLLLDAVFDLLRSVIKDISFYFKFQSFNKAIIGYWWDEGNAYAA